MRRVGDVLSAILDDNLLKQARGYSVFFDCWKDLAEKNGIAAAADHSWIKSLERGLVWIEVDHPGWKQILQTKESKLLSDFRRRFPDMGISGISIVLCRPGTQNQSQYAETTPTEENIFVKEPTPPVPEEEYNVIKDGALKDALMRLEQSITEAPKQMNS